MRLNHFLMNKPEGAIRAAITSHTGFLSLFRPKRFCRMPHTDVTFMSCQILLWSRTSKTAYDQLTTIFSSFSPQCRQQTGQGNEEDAFRWVTNFFHNVTDSAYYSHNAWKLACFKSDGTDGCVLQNNPEEAVYLCLLGSAIRECSDFFSIIGLRPKYDRNVFDFPQQYNSNDVNSIDYLSALVISHSVRMEESHTASHESDTKRLHRTRVSRHLDKIVPDTNNKRRLPMNRILGHQHGHPRRLVDGKYYEFVGILTNENGGDHGDLFTASISQHETNLFQKKDHLKNTLGEVTVVDGSGDEGGTNDDSERDEDEDSGNNDNNGGGSDHSKKSHRRGRGKGRRGDHRKKGVKKKGKATGRLGDEGVMNNPEDDEAVEEQGGNQS
jgi:hypothetical protein